MSWSFKLLTIKGIPVRIHASFLLVLVVAAASGLGSGGDDWLRSSAFMVILVLLLFVCVALHELGHSLVAQRYGVQVQDITLWPIGGVARISRLPSRPYQEFLITAAGPATNLALAVVLGALALTWIGPDQVLRLIAYPRLLDRFLASQEVRPLVLLLAINNLILALFNLIPAFPMDGGRLLRSLLAVFLPFRRATQLAALLGQVLAVLMTILGLRSHNYLLALVGVFVFLAAWQERQQTMMRESLKGITVRQAIRPIGPRLNPGLSLGQAAAQAASAPQAAYLVVDGNKLTGVLLRDDLLSAVRKAGHAAAITPYLRRSTLRLRPEETLDVALERIAQGRTGFALVVDDGQVIGTISQTDLLRLAEILGAHPGALREAGQ
jgi:Zn-dependent protease/CBS domain-containing protein